MARTNDGLVFGAVTKVIQAGDIAYFSPVPQVNNLSVQVNPTTTGTCEVYLTTVPNSEFADEISGGNELTHWKLWDQGQVSANTVDYVDFTPTGIKVKAITGEWHVYVRPA